MLCVDIALFANDGLPLCSPFKAKVMTPDGAVLVRENTAAKGI